MALTTILPQDGHVVEIGTFDEKSKLFYDVSANSLLIQTPGADLALVDRVTVSNAGLVTLSGALTVAGAVIATADMKVNLTLTAGADGVGTDGEQLTSGGADAECDWSAAGSLREVKDIHGELSPAEALNKVLETPVHLFHYKDGVRPTTKDYETEYAGVVADEAPWAMHHNGRILNPINTFGYTVAAIQEMSRQLAELREKVNAT